MANKAFIWPSGPNVATTDDIPTSVSAGCTCVVVDDSGAVVANSDPVQDNYSPYFHTSSLTSASTMADVRADWLSQIQTMYADPSLTAVYMD
jgi:hypothetical protein